MGGSLKGHSNSSTSSSNGSRGRSYGLILLLAFGAAIFGMMLLHKLREKRIFSLLVKEKDRELNSLQLLLQKEREYNKEVKRKNQEIKAKVYALQMQRKEQDNRMLDMRSTISSLRDEQRMIETALEEKQNELKLLQEKESESRKENPRLLALTEVLKQKEVEIEDLKYRLGYPVKVWSVSTDDPSKPEVNITRVTPRDGIEANKTREGGENSGRIADGSENESISAPDEKNLARDEDGNKSRVGFSNRMELSRDQEVSGGNTDSKKAMDEVEARKTDNSQDREGFGVEEHKTNASASEVLGNHGGEVLKSRDGSSDKKEITVDDIDHGIAEIRKREKLNSQDNEDWPHSLDTVKLEKIENSQKDYRASWKHGHLSRTREQRLRMVAAKNRRSERSVNSEDNGGLNMRGKGVFKDGFRKEKSMREKDGGQEKRDGQLHHNMVLKMKDRLRRVGNVGDDHQQGERLDEKIDKMAGLEVTDAKDATDEVKKTVNGTTVGSLEPQSFKDGNFSLKTSNISMNQQVEKLQEMDEVRVNTKTPKDEVSVSRSMSMDNETGGNDNKQNPNELDELEEQVRGVHRQEDRSNDRVDAEDDKYADPEDINIANIQEAERDFLRESDDPDLDDDKDEYKEDGDEPEF